MPNQRAKRIEASQWLARKPRLEKLWLIEKRPISEVIETMKKQYNFSATESQYEAQFRGWKWRKNQKSDLWLAVTQAVIDCERQGKPWEVLIAGELQSRQKIEKEMLRLRSSASTQLVPTRQTPRLPSGVSVRVPAVENALWTLNLPFEVFQFEVCRQALSSPFLRGSSPRRQVLELLDENDHSGEKSTVPFCPQGVSRQHDLWVPDTATSAALEAIVPSSIAELSLPSTSPLASHLHGFVSPLYRNVLFSVANNFAGLNSSARTRIIRYLLKETDETLYKLILSIPGPSGQAIVQNIFKCAIEMGDAGIVELLLWKKAADIGINQLYCFEPGGGIISTPIERVVILRNQDVVEILLGHDADVNRTYPEYFFSRHGALSCALYAVHQNRPYELNPDLRLFDLLINAGGELSPPTLQDLIRSDHMNLSFAVLLRGTTKSFLRWNALGIIHTAILRLEENFLLELLNLMVERGVDLNHYWKDPSLRASGTMIDLAAKTGKLHLVRELFYKKASLTNDILPYGIASGNEDLIRFLLFDLHADSFGVGPLQITPLAAAIRLQRFWVTEILIDRGAMNQMADKSHCLPALEAASEVRNIDLLERIVKLIKNVDSEMLGYALSNAIKDGMDVFALDLIDAGADMDYEGNNPPLLEALKRRSQSLIFALLNAGAYAMRYAQNESRNPEKYLQLAVDWGDRSIIKALIDAGADVNEVSSHSPSWAPLNAAIEKNDVDLLEALLEAGADINNPWSRMRGRTALSDAVLTKRIEMVARLLDYGADPQDPRAIEEASALQDERFLDLILESHSKRYPRGRKGFGSKALKLAIDAGDMKRITKLLRRNADYNGLDEHSGDLHEDTAFGRAICRDEGDRDIFVELLLQEGRCDPNGVIFATDRRGLRRGGAVYYRRVTALLAAVEERKDSTVRLLLKYGANVNLPVRGKILRTPLQQAAEIGSMEIMQLLLDHGADVNGAAAQRGGGTALQFAAVGGYAPLVCLLLSHGAEVDAPCSKVDGLTALEAAASGGRLDTVQILLNAGAASKPETRKQIANAIALANDQGHLAVSRLLEAHARASSVSEIPTQATDPAHSHEEDDHGTVDHANESNEWSEETYITCPNGYAAMIAENDFLPFALAYEPQANFKDWDGSLNIFEPA